MNRDQRRQLEFLVVLVFCSSLFVVINVISLELFPIVWGDEVMFTEPAANLALDGEFVSRSWGYQSETEVWAGNAPLHSLLLSCWIKFFGLSITVVRSFGLFVVGLSALVMADLLRRTSLLTRGATTAWIVTIALCTYGLALNYRSGRYDGVGILLVMLGVWAAFNSWRLRYGLLVVSAILIPMAGLHVAVASVAVCAIALVIWHRTALLPVAIALVSLGLGGAIFLASLNFLEVLDSFRYTVTRLRAIPEGSMPKDPSLFLLLLAALLLTAVASISRLTIWNRKFIFLWAVSIGVPVTVWSAGRFPTYYTWMAILPLCSILGLLFEKLWPIRDTVEPMLRCSIWVSMSLVALAVLCGLPLQLVSSTAYRQDRDYQKVTEFVNRVVNPMDTAMVDPAAWYASRPRALKTYTVLYDVEDRFLTEADRCQINVVVIRPKDREYTLKRLRGDWVMTSQLAPPQRTSFGPLRRNFGDKLVETYSLVAFRRVNC